MEVPRKEIRVSTNQKKEHGGYLGDSGVKFQNERIKSKSVYWKEIAF